MPPRIAGTTVPYDRDRFPGDVVIIHILTLSSAPLSSLQDGHDRESDGMELEEFALGESALGTATSSGVEEGIGLGGGRGLKAAASTAASNLRRNVRSMLNAQQQQQHQQVRNT